MNLLFEISPAVDPPWRPIRIGSDEQRVGRLTRREPPRDDRVAYAASADPEDQQRSNPRGDRIVMPLEAATRGRAARGRPARRDTRVGAEIHANRDQTDDERGGHSAASHCRTA